MLASLLKKIILTTARHRGGGGGTTTNSYYHTSCTVLRRTREISGGKFSKIFGISPGPHFNLSSGQLGLSNLSRPLHTSPWLTQASFEDGGSFFGFDTQKVSSTLKDAAAACGIRPKSKGGAAAEQPLIGTPLNFKNDVSLSQYFQSELASGGINGEKKALIFDNQSFTFKELDELSNKVAVTLKNKLEEGKWMSTNKNPDGDFVIGLCLPPSHQFIVFMFAIHKLGATYLPLEGKFPEARINHIVNVARPLMIISEEDQTTLDKFKPYQNDVRIVRGDKIWTRMETNFPKGSPSPPMVEPLQALDVDDDEEAAKSLSTAQSDLSLRPAFIFFTSGSTGVPKGVRRSHRSVMNRIRWGWDQLPLLPNDISCLKTTISFGDTIMEIFPPLLKGLPLVVIDRDSARQPHLLAQKIKEHQITRLVLVPSILDNLLTTIEMNDKDGLLDSIRLWMCTSEALSFSLVQKFFKLFPKGKTICNLYGSTETTCDNNGEMFQSVADMQKKCVGDPGNEVPLGKPIYNTVNYILKPNLEPVEEGEVGEIYISGPGLALGYVGLNKSEKFMKNPFTDDPVYSRMYRTGDFGRFGKMKNGERTLFYKGRVDSQVKVRGQRVDLSEIQAAVNKLKEVKKGVVLCFHPGQPDQAIIAFISLNKDSQNKGHETEMMEAIRGNLKTNLLKYQQPLIRIIPEIPMLSSGKTDRQSLLKIFGQEREHRQEFNDWGRLGIKDEKKLDSLKALVGTISKSTGTRVEEIVSNMKDSFYNLGGTSLNSIPVIAELRKLKYFITIPDFVKAKSVQELHEMLTPLETADGKSRDLQLGANAWKEYKPEILNESHQKEAIEIIASSFSGKGDLEKYVNVTKQDFYTWIPTLWSTFVGEGYSYVIRRRKDDKMIAAIFNNDFYDSPPHGDVSPPLQTILTFLDDVQEPQKENLPKGKGKLMMALVFGSHESLSDAENVYVAQIADEETCRLAQSLGFEGVVTTNVSPVFQQIAKEVMNFEPLHEVQINKYVTADGKRPFGAAPDSERVVVCWKKLN